MCLTKITKVLEPPDPKVRKGWKMVEVGARDDGTYLSLYRSLEGHEYDQCLLPKRTWLRSTKTALRTERLCPFSETATYGAGFHVFTAKAENRKGWPQPNLICGTKEVPVFYRNTRTMGRQYYGDVCHVADEIMYLDGDKHPAKVPDVPTAKAAKAPKAKAVKVTATKGKAVKKAAGKRRSG